VKIAFGVCSLGIGHATRSAPLINKLIDEGHEVVLISYGRAAELLRREYGELKLYELPDFPIEYPERAHQFIPYFFMNSNKIVGMMLKSHRRFLELHEKEGFDLIVSDSRFDVFHRKVPSYLIIHQLRIMVPLKVLRFGIMIYNSYITRFFKKILVPDFRENSLSGDMSHNLRIIDGSKIEYIGPLSPFKQRRVEKDIDILISISGPEPQRSIFEKKVLEEIRELKGNVVVTLGKPDGEREMDNVKVYSYLPMEKREEIMNRSKLIISRSGYSTIMDLYVIGGKAMFVPTPGQPEQEYLAKYLESRKIAGFAHQDSLDLKDLVSRSRKYRGFDGGYDVSRSVENFMRVIGDGD